MTPAEITLALHTKLSEVFAEQEAMTTLYAERLKDLDCEYLALAERFRTAGYPKAAEHVDAEHWTTRAMVVQSLDRSTVLYDKVIAQIYSVLGVQAV